MLNIKKNKRKHTLIVKSTVKECGWVSGFPDQVAAPPFCHDIPGLGRKVQFGIQIGPDWPQMEQIWDFLRSVSVPFGSEIDLKKSQICPIWGPIWIWPNLDAKYDIPSDTDTIDQGCQLPEKYIKTVTRTHQIIAKNG